MSRSWFWAAAVVLAAAAPAAAQPPSPLELVRGIRESGMPDLALEYLKEVEGKLSPDDKVAAPLERAKCLLDAAVDEADEGTRTSMIGEAKEGFNTFLATNARHPRASEASLALARLTALEAKAQLNRGRRMDVPPKDDPGYEEAIKKQREEMLKARPLFLNASKLFADAAKQLKDKLADPALDPATKAALGREAFDADLAAATNKYYLADTFLVTDAKETIERDKFLEEARDTFATLAKGPPTSRTVWIGRAWMAEVLADQGKPNDAAAEFAEILKAPRLEAEEGKRLVRFFQIRRAYLAALTDLTTAKLQASEVELKQWLSRYGAGRRPSPEVLAARFYLAFDLQLQAQVLIGPPPKDGKPVVIGQTPRAKLQEAEKLYRALGQTDHDYTLRANRNRMQVVRRLLGEADRPASSYLSFEEAQMAALIQMAKLGDAERALARARADDDDAPFWHAAYRQVSAARTEAEVRDRKHRVVALLERARELATDKDPPADVADNLLRLVYFYQSTDQPYQAAVLGEHIARTIKTAGGKGAVAGLLSLNGYVNAGKRVSNVAKAAEAVALIREAFPVVPEVPPDLVAQQEQKINEANAEAHRADRDRAVGVARFLDEKFPNDTATDSARHRLALLLNEEKKFDQAFQVITKVRPGYSAVSNARQLEGYLAAVIIGSKEVSAEVKRDVFRRAVADLGKFAAQKPGAAATEEDARGYLSCRLRLAQLLLSQNRVDPESEAAGRGFARALAVADDVLAAIPGFDSLREKDKEKDKKLNLDGLNLHGAELRLQAFDVHTRALYLRGKTLVDEKKYDEAAKAIEPVVADVAKGMLFDDRMKKWADGRGDLLDPNQPDSDENRDPPQVAAAKSKIASLAAGIDRSRRDIVMVGFKLGCVQGSKDEAGKMLDTLKKAGGGVEANQQALENMARELAAQISILRRENKKAEADALGEGLTLLLKEFTSLKDLPPNTILFLGTTFYTVGQYDDALKEFAKIKVPALSPEARKALAAKDPAVKADTPWWDIDPTKIEDGPTRNKLRDEIRDYRYAQLHVARCLRAAGKFAECEAMLVGAVGTPPAKPGEQPKKGYAYSSLDFRKELAYMHEAKAATITTVKEANTEWGKALKEWTTLFQIAQGAVGKLTPATPADVAIKTKNNFFDAFFEVQRVVVDANVHLIKDPAKLAPKLEKPGGDIVKLETINQFEELAKKGQPLITPEVALRYWELLEKHPALKKAYQEKGGKFFLQKPKVAD